MPLVLLQWAPLLPLYPTAATIGKLGISFETAPNSQAIGTFVNSVLLLSILCHLIEQCLYTRTFPLQHHHHPPLSPPPFPTPPPPPPPISTYYNSQSVKNGQTTPLLLLELHRLYPTILLLLCPVSYSSLLTSLRISQNSILYNTPSIDSHSLGLYWAGQS